MAITLLSGPIPPPKPAKKISSSSALAALRWNTLEEVFCYMIKINPFPFLARVHIFSQILFNKDSATLLLEVKYDIRALEH